MVGWWDNLDFVLQGLAPGLVQGLAPGLVQGLVQGPGLVSGPLWSSHSGQHRPIEYS